MAFADHNPPARREQPPPRYDVSAWQQVAEWQERNPALADMALNPTDWVRWEDQMTYGETERRAWYDHGALEHHGRKGMK